MARLDQRRGEQLSSALLLRRISVTGHLFILIFVRGTFLRLFRNWFSKTSGIQMEEKTNLGIHDLNIGEQL